MAEINLTDEQAKQIKQQLISKLPNFPKDKRPEMEKKIKSLSNKALLEFLEQNNLLGDLTSEENCIFCSIVNKKTPSHRIVESEESIAVLELNPITTGHTLVIPRKHIQEIPISIHEVADKTAEVLKQKLNAKGIKKQEANIMGHQFINLIPIYTDEDENRTKRVPANEKDLKEIQKIITEKTKETEKIIKTEKQEPEEPKVIPKIKPRIPD
jgi:histidine triad (HIT) family protein